MEYPLNSYFAFRYGADGDKVGRAAHYMEIFYRTPCGDCLLVAEVTDTDRDAKVYILTPHISPKALKAISELVEILLVKKEKKVL